MSRTVIARLMRSNALLTQIDKGPPMKITQPQKKALQLIDGGYVKHCHPFTFTTAHSATGRAA